MTLVNVEVAKKTHRNFPNHSSLHYVIFCIDTESDDIKRNAILAQNHVGRLFPGWVVTRLVLTNPTQKQNAETEHEKDGK